MKDRILRNAAHGNFGPVLKSRRDDSPLTRDEVDILLRLACKFGSLQAVKHLVDEFGADVSSQNKNHETPLHVACLHNSRAVARYLLRHGARLDDVTSEISGSQTALSIAFDNNYFKLFKLLLRPQYRPISGKPLMFLKSHPQKDAPSKKIFIDYVATLDQPPHRVTTEVNAFVPVKSYNTNIVELPEEMLLNIFKFLNVEDLFRILTVCKQWHNICVDYTSSHNEEWISRANNIAFSQQRGAAKFKNAEPFKLYFFIKNQARKTFDDKVAFDLIFAENPDIAKIMELVKSGNELKPLLSLELRRKNLQKVLDAYYKFLAPESLFKEGSQVIFSRQSVAVLEDIFEREKRINGSYSDNSAYLAAAYAKVCVVKKVMEVASFPYSKETMLTNALRYNTHDVIDLIVNAGAKINSSHLVDAALCGHEDLFYLWYEANKLTLIQHFTLVNGAIMQGLTSLVVYLLQDDEFIKNCNIFDVMTAILNYGNLKMLEVVLERFKYNLVSTLLFAFSDAKAPEDKILAIIKKCGKVDGLDVNGKTALMYAAEKGYVQAFELLQSFDSDIYLRDKNGNTVLHHACLGGKLATARVILAHDPEFINVKNNFGETPYDLVKNASEASTKLEELLESYLPQTRLSYEI